ncbi:lysophospholipid acyltransferase family protein [Kytococcus sedentarius]|uniref:lysophospholipid acyltransferase family protein n=1 Tax=Kytococcus sedentarius TaxID=1276 RepID=UPI0035BC1ED9
MSTVYNLLLPPAYTMFWAQGLRIRVEGREHIPATGGAVIAMNHIGYLDYVFAGLAVRSRRRQVRFMAKKELFDKPVLGHALRSMRHIQVDRDAGGSALQNGVDALRRGELVGVFPEATISRSFELKGFKTGAVRMAMAADVPVVPLVNWGAHVLATKGLPRRLGRTRTPIILSVGEPMRFAPGTDPLQATDALRVQMDELLRAAQGEYGPMPPELSAYEPARTGGTAPTLMEADALDAQDVAERRRRRVERAEREAAKKARRRR